MPRQAAVLIMRAGAAGLGLPAASIQQASIGVHTRLTIPFHNNRKLETYTNIAGGLGKPFIVEEFGEGVGGVVWG